MEEVSHVCLCGGEACVCVGVCVWGGGGRWGLKKQRRLLLGLSPVPCLLAVKLISEEKYTLCLYNAGLCLWSASEPLTILEIVSSLLKYFQTVTVEPVSFPFNCLASVLTVGLSHHQRVMAFRLGLLCFGWCCHLPTWSRASVISNSRQQFPSFLISPSYPHNFRWTAKW